MSEEGLFDELPRVLVEARTELGFRQAEVAERAGISTGMLSAYERGKQRPKLETLEKVLEALGLDVEELGRRLRRGKVPKRFEIPEGSGYLPEVTAMAVSRFLEDLAAMTALAIRRPVRTQTKSGTAATSRDTDAGDR